jgi:FkbM family methyltransferase
MDNLKDEEQLVELMYTISATYYLKNENIFTDWQGIQWPQSMWPGNFPEKSPKTPIEGDGFRAGRAEWLGFGLAALAAISTKSHPIAVELGSSQGLWSINWLVMFNRMLPEIPSKAVGYEASDCFDSTIDFWKLNTQIEKTILKKRKLIIIGDHWAFTLNRKAVHKSGKKVYFPKIQVQEDNGAQVVSKNSNRNRIDYRGKTVELETVSSKTLNQIVKKHKKINLLHIDIQGGELEIFNRRAIDLCSKKVDTMVIGTHSHLNHAELQTLFRKKFHLVASEEPKFENETLIEDGTLVFLHKKTRHSISNNFEPNKRKLLEILQK